MLRNKSYILFFAAILTCMTSIVVNAGEKGAITIFVENKALQPRIVQVRDLVGYAKAASICEDAKMTVEKCKRIETGTTTNKWSSIYKLSESDCAKAEIALKTKKCLYPDLILDQKLDAGEKVEIKIKTNYMGYGEVAVRAEDNTFDWTVKTNIKEGDIIGHQ